MNEITYNIFYYLVGSVQSPGMNNIDIIIFIIHVSHSEYVTVWASSNMEHSFMLVSIKAELY